MKKLFSKIRAWIAMFSAFIMNLSPLGIRARGICAPTYDCPGCPWSTFGCPAGTVAYQSYIGKFPWSVLGFMALIGAISGRIVCGVICPFGLIQDFLNKIPSPKYTIPRWARYIKYGVLLFLVILFPFLMGLDAKEKISYIDIKDLSITSKDDGIEYSIILENNSAGVVTNPTVDLRFIYNDPEKQAETVSFPTETVIKAGEQQTVKFKYANKASEVNYKLEVSSPQSLPGHYLSHPYLYYCKVCPVGTGTAMLPIAISKKKVAIIKNGWFRFTIFIILLIGIIFVSRLFCRTICPIGAFYGLINKLSFFRMKFIKEKCIGCKACNKVCPMGLDVTKEIGSAECILCGDCTRICPKKALERTNIFKGNKQWIQKQNTKALQK